MKYSGYSVQWLCAIALFVAAPGLAATLKDGATGQVVSTLDIDAAIRRNAALAQLDKSETLAVMGFTLEARTPSQIHVSASSEFLTLSVLSGKVRMNGQTARAGDALVTAFTGAKTIVAPYDAARLAGTASPAMAAEVAMILTPIIKRRKTETFFGAFVPTGINATSPGNPIAEPIRRQILLDPAVLALRTSPSDLKSSVATHFVQAIEANDASTVAGLLDPAPFLSAGRDWATTRLAYASANIATWRAQAPIQIIQIEGNTASLDIGGHTGALTLVSREGRYFVTGMEVQP